MIDETSDAFESTCDWPDASYAATVKPSFDPGRIACTVKHSLSGAAGVETLLRVGAAKWAVEYRCAETMVLGADTSGLDDLNEQGPLSGTTQIVLDARDVGDSNLHLWPGVITVEECSLDTTQAQWGTSPVKIAAGRWLVRGAPLKVEHQGNSPLVFRPDPQISDGKVSIRQDAARVDTRFVISANPDRIDLLKESRSGALQACWATALAMLPYVDEYKIEEEDGVLRVPQCQLGEAIIEKLRSADPDLSLWNDKDEWDPMRAATLMLELPVPFQDENE